MLRATLHGGHPRIIRIGSFRIETVPGETSGIASPVAEGFARNGDCADRSTTRNAKRTRRCFEGCTARPYVVDQDDRRTGIDRRSGRTAHGDRLVECAPPLRATETVERRDGARTFEKIHDDQSRRTRRCIRKESRVIEAALSPACRVGGDRHQHRRGTAAGAVVHLCTKFGGNERNRRSERRTERLGKSRHAMELQGAQRVAETRPIRADARGGTETGGWRLELHCMRVDQRAATRDAEQRTLGATCAAALGRDQVEERCCNTLQSAERIAEQEAERHPPILKRAAYGARTMGQMSTPSGCTAVPAPLAAISAAEWERLLATNPAASAFSQRVVHDAWWSGYGDGAEDISLAVRNESGALCGYLPLMRRPDGVRYLGATFHIDYATVLLELSPGGCAPEAIDALVAALFADPSPLDLRRLRRADPAHALLIDAIARAGTERTRPATVSVEEPAPSIDLRGIDSLDAHLERLDKKDRHEIRRKVRRGEAASVTIAAHEPTNEALEEFIRLHRARWGERGLFTPNDAGARDERFMRALFAAAPRDLILVLLARNAEFGTFAAALLLRDATGLRYWNAGGDAAARALSPGILLFVAGIERAIAERKETFDFLRGNESYKYEVGAVDSDVLQVQVAEAHR